MGQKKKIKEIVVRVCIVAMVWAFCPAARADRPLERQEILNIFETLTSRPVTTWIPSGTIAARHEQYKPAKTTDEAEILKEIQSRIEQYRASEDKELSAEWQAKRIAAMPFNVRYELSNTCTMVSTETVTYDGSRFYWQIDVESRVDSVQVPPELQGDLPTEEFNIEWNQRRVFAWDGEKHTNYYRSGNSATITAKRGGVNGPLTAGVIPWGHGLYSMEILSAAEAAGYETESDGLTEIHLSLTRNNRGETLVLDPARDYAVLLSSVSLSGAIMVVREYDNYQLVGDKWCPASITITQYDTTAESKKLMARDVWTLTSITTAVPDKSSFEVQFDYGATINDMRFAPPLLYRYLPPEAPTARNMHLKRPLEMKLEKFARIGRCIWKSVYST